MKDVFNAIVDFVKGLMQPAITVVAVSILVGLAKSGYDPDKIFALAGAVILFWFGYTAIKNFNFNGKSNGNGTPTKKADSGQSTAEADDVSAVEEKPKDEYYIFGDTGFNVSPKGKVSFDKDAFLADVSQSATRRLQGTGQELTSAAMYYTARDKVSGLAAPWKFTNIPALKDAIICLSDLVGKAFEEIWAQDYETAMNPANKCSSCGCGHDACGCNKETNSMAKHFIELEYQRVQKILADLG